MQECHKESIEERSNAGQSSGGRGARGLYQGHQTGRETTVMPLCVCPLTTAGTSLCFLSVCFAASPLKLFASSWLLSRAVWLGGLLWALESSRSPERRGHEIVLPWERAVCYLLHQAPQLGEDGETVSVKSTRCLTSA